jgi:hypothetical protein
MRTIIDGLRYDTATSTRVWVYTYPHPRLPCLVEEILYRTPGGAYCLYYGRLYGQTEFNEGLTPLREEDARLWCEHHGVPEAVLEEYFPVEDA